MLLVLTAAGKNLMSTMKIAALAVAGASSVAVVCAIAGVVMHTVVAMHATMNPERMRAFIILFNSCRPSRTVEPSKALLRRR